MPVDVVDPGEVGVGEGGGEGDDPDDGDDLDGAAEPGHGVLVQRMADRQVALHRERHDRQHGRVAGPKKETDSRSVGNVIAEACSRFYRETVLAQIMTDRYRYKVPTYYLVL